jgi:hypothetical protein
MVAYDLICKKNHRFEGWFPSFEDYQKQAARGEISCPTCGTTKVEKMPHACAVHIKHETKKEPKQSKKNPSPQPPSPAEAKELLIQLHHYIRKNYEDVGPRFAEEARQIFYGKAKERPIHGSATPQERENLDEEGVPFLTIPKPELDS